MRKLLATTQPLKYGDLYLGKSATSLQTIAKQSSIPLTVDHGDRKIGEIRSLHYEEENGIGKLTGVISDKLLKQFRKHGLSLKYHAAIRDNLIDIRKLIHATLTPTPRDNHTLVSDGEGELFEFQDSEDTAPETTTTPTEATAEPEDAGTEIEITDAVLNAIRDRLLSDPDLLKKLQQPAGDPKPEDPKEENPTKDPEPTETPKPTEPLKIIIKPAKPVVQSAPPTPKLPIQRPFRSIKG